MQQSEEPPPSAPDVCVLSPSGHERACMWFTSSEVYRMYLAMVFARNPACRLPSQRIALPTLVWVKTAEQLLMRSQATQAQNREGRHPPNYDQALSPPDYQRRWFAEMLSIHEAATNCVRGLAVDCGLFEALATSLLGGGGSAGAGAGKRGPSAALTEADGGPQSVCAALAACCFSPLASSLWDTSSSAATSPSNPLDKLPAAVPWVEGRSGAEGCDERSSSAEADAVLAPLRASRSLRRIAMCMLAESVSRGCRKLVRSLAGNAGPPRTAADAGALATSLLRDALGVDEASVPIPKPEGEPDDPSLSRPAGHSGAFDAQRALRHSTRFFAPGGRYSGMGHHNCSPQGIVGVVLLHLAMRAGLGSDVVMQLVRRRELSMKTFFNAAMPGLDPGLVQVNAVQLTGPAFLISSPARLLNSVSCLYLRRRRCTRRGCGTTAPGSAGRRPP